MWFKNLSCYRLLEPFSLTETQFEESLKRREFRPCGSLEQFTLGWVAPIHPNGNSLIHVANGFIMICVCKEEKVLPPAVINDMVSEKTFEIEKKEQRKIRKKERENIRDDIIHTLLPRALSFTRRTYAYIDTRNNWLIVDSGTTNSADELTSYLRKTLESLKIKPPSTKDRPALVFTRWLEEQRTPADISLENECDLRSTDKETNIVRCKRQDLFSEEIQAHLEAGKECIKLALTWNDRLSFIVDENLTIKRLQFLELIQDQAAEVDSQDKAQLFDTHFVIMTLELAAFLPKLLELFGGEDTHRKQ